MTTATARHDASRTHAPRPCIRPRRAITGMSAVLLPCTGAGEIDWGGFESLLHRTASAGLVPVVNMDTGYGPWLTDAQRLRVLGVTRRVLGGGSFYAGAFVDDAPGDAFDLDAYRRAAGAILDHGARPVVFQSYGLTALRGGALGEAYARIGEHAGPFLGFELGAMFAPFGAIYDIESFEAMMRVPQCIGAKHSSLDRGLEWERLALRDRLRPGFMVLTGNDRAIDMVMYGSDYLLGLATFDPAAFARRDAMWGAGDGDFHLLNDLLQRLGDLAFRDPVPAYRHSAAQFLKLRGWIDGDATHPRCPRRPDSDAEALRRLAEELEPWG